MQLLPGHNSLQHYNAQSMQHRDTAGGGCGPMGACSVPRGDEDQRVLPLKKPLKAPGLHSAVGLTAGSLGHSWKAPAGNQINTEVFLYCPCSIPPSSLLCICIHALLVIAKDPLLPPCQSWM